MGTTVQRAICSFGGGGGGAKGLQGSRASLFGNDAAFKMCGSFDNDRYACKVYQYLTETEQVCCNVREMTPAMMREFYGEESPFLIVGSAPCLPAHGLVITSTGARRIDSIRPGDMVLTHKGRYRKVLKVGSDDYTGIMYGIRVAGTVDFQEFTAEHPIYVRRFWAPKVGKRQRKTIGPAQFMKASEVRKGDLIGFPIGEEDPGCAERFIASFGDPRVTHRRADTTTKDGRKLRTASTVITNKVVDLRPHANNPSLWFLLGAYLGDGCRRDASNEVVYSVGAETSELATLVRKSLDDVGLGHRDSNEWSLSNISIRTNSKALCRIAAAFGSSGHTKSIPPELFGLRPDLVRALLDGYHAADGSDSQVARVVKKTGKKPSLWRVNSTSLDLLRGVQRLLLRLGIYGSVHLNSPAGEAVIEGRPCKTLTLWELTYQPDKVKRGNAVFDVPAGDIKRPPGKFANRKPPRTKLSPMVKDGCVWTTVREIVERPTHEAVWNIEVEEDHTFCAPMQIVSNCQGSSKLLATAKAKTAFYVSLNELALVNLRLIIEAWAPTLMHHGELLTVDAETRTRALAGLPGLILFENVPNITSRAQPMLREMRRLLTAVGFVLQDGYHECRHVGNLAQRRKRWFLIARNPASVPAFLYRPPHRPGLVCGDVLNPLPMPGDPAGGPMHELPTISALNWWRLWAIPAGGDWRDLLPNDGTPKRKRFRRHHVEKMSDPSIAVAGTGSNGPCAVADERTGPDMLGQPCATGEGQPKRSAVCSARPQGAFDLRVVAKVPRNWPTFTSLTPERT